MRCNYKSTKQKSESPARAIVDWFPIELRQHRIIINKYFVPYSSYTTNSRQPTNSTRRVINDWLEAKQCFFLRRQHQVKNSNEPFNKWFQHIAETARSIINSSIWWVFRVRFFSNVVQFICSRFLFDRSRTTSKPKKHLNHK